MILVQTDCGTRVRDNFVFGQRRVEVVEEYDATGLTNQYVYEAASIRRCEMASGGEEWWYHRDVLLTTRVLSDSSGQQLGTRYAYEPFGLLTTNPAGNNRYRLQASVYSKRSMFTIRVRDSIRRPWGGFYNAIRKDS